MKSKKLELIGLLKIFLEMRGRTMEGDGVGRVGWRDVRGRRKEL